MSDPSEKAGASCYDMKFGDYQRGDEEEIVPILSESFGRSPGGMEKWRWKHCNRPGFKESEIVTARIDGKIVACFHGATLPLKLEPGIVVQMRFDGDFAVLPEYRGRSIPSRVHDLTDRQLKEAGVALRGGFTSKELNERFYHKKFGYVFIPTASTNFRKVIGVNALREKIESLGEKFVADSALRKTIQDNPIIINCEVDGFEPFHLHLSEKAFCLNDAFSDRADMSMKSPYKVIMNLSLGFVPFFKSSLLSFLTGKLRVRGIFRTRKSLFQLLWAAIKIR